MKAREYNKRIDIYEFSDSPDGFGGNKGGFNLKSQSWAKLVNKDSSVNQRTTALGLTNLQQPLIFRLRFRNDLIYQERTFYLRYNFELYVIQSITNIDMMNREIEIVCIKQSDQFID